MADRGKRTGREGDSNNALAVDKKADETESRATARAMIEPDFRHAIAVAQALKSHFSESLSKPGIGDYADAIADKSAAGERGELNFVNRMLAAQAITLDTIFSEMARRMALNMGDYLGATETYSRIALKAQAQSRSTLEALAKLHQPREQTVRHVHVNEGGQAVIADQFHHHHRGRKNEQNSEQPHAPGHNPADGGPAMLGHDAQGNGVPISTGQRRKAVQNARRQG